MTRLPLPGWLPKRLLTVEEVADLLRLSTRQVRRLIADGRLQAVHLGRAVRVEPGALARLIEDGK